MSEIECANCHLVVQVEQALFDEQIRVFVCRNCLVDAWVRKAMNSPLAKAGIRIGQEERLRVQFYMQALKNFKRLKGERVLLNDDERRVVEAYEEIKKKNPQIEKNVKG